MQLHTPEAFVKSSATVFTLASVTHFSHKLHTWKNQITSLLTTHFRLVLVVRGVLLQITNLDAAAHLGVDGGTKDRDSDWDLLVAWKSSGDDKLADLELSIDDGASVAFHLRPTADKREARGARFAADFTLQAAET